MNGNNSTMSVRAFITIILFIASGILFFMDRPYWYFGILTLTVAILIPLISAMWKIAGWGANKVEEFTHKDTRIEFSFDDDTKEDSK